MIVNGWLISYQKYPHSQVEFTTKKRILFDNQRFFYIFLCHPIFMFKDKLHIVVKCYPNAFGTYFTFGNPHILSANPTVMANNTLLLQ